MFDLNCCTSSSEDEVLDDGLFIELCKLSPESEDCRAVI